MRDEMSSDKPMQWALGLLIAAAVVAALACDNSVNFSPTAPQWPDWQDLEPGERLLQISGNLVAEDGTCVEATILFDGQELAGARAVCAEIEGCENLELKAFLTSMSGHHTIGFRVLEQSAETMSYWAAGSVLVDREGLSFGGVTLPLGPTRVALQRGGIVNFEIDFAG